MTKTARQAARDREPLDGADAQALEGALAMTERELAAAEERNRELVRKLDQLSDCGQDGVCAISPGCVRHWAQRNHELVRERDNAVLKAQAYERDWCESKSIFGSARAKLSARAIAAETQRDALQEELGRLRWGVAANAPRLSNATSRWAAVREATGLGSTSARQLCADAGFDPDEQTKEDLGVILKRQMQESARKEAYSRAWELAILDGATREQAHEIARKASAK